MKSVSRSSGKQQRNRLDRFASWPRETAQRALNEAVHQYRDSDRNDEQSSKGKCGLRDPTLEQQYAQYGHEPHQCSGPGPLGDEDLRIVRKLVTRPE